MNYKDKLNSVVDHAINTNYAIHERAPKVWNAVSTHEVCVFGTGEFFNDCADDEHLAHFEYVCDNNPEKWGKKFKGRLCLSPDELKEKKDIITIIMVGDWRPIYRQLQAMGINAYPMDWYTLNVYDPHYSSTWFENERKNIIETVDIFNDEKSKEIYTEAVTLRISPELSEKIFNDIKTPGEYFNTGLFNFSDKENFLDAGAYRGDSVKKFISAVHGKYSNIYSFELDSSIFKELKKNVSSLDNIHLYNYGVSDRSSDVEYTYSGNQTRTEKVVAPDEILGNCPISFIKMDVEGFEIKALNGSQKIISEQKPKLAISAYHYLSDLWMVPRKIFEINPQYKIFLRHHAPCVWDTDCYAY